MGFLSARSIFWSNFLLLLASSREAEAIDPDVCLHEYCSAYPCLTSLEESDEDYNETMTKNVLCVLYPTNLLNCSWSLDTLPKESQLFVHISICDDMTTLRSLNYSSVDKVGWRSLIMDEHDVSYVSFQYSFSLHDQPQLYTYTYSMGQIVVLPPPPNFSASLRDGELLVTWSPPINRATKNLKCFEYQLDMGDQEKFKDLEDQLSYTEPSVIPGHTYRMRIRTKMRHKCRKNAPWSDWSPAVTVEQSPYKLSILVIVLISLGIPMILLAVLLVVRYQRVSKILFPPIPRPPQKYKYFLEISDTFNFFHNASSSAEPTEEETVTVVEHTEEKPLEDILRTK